MKKNQASGTGESSTRNRWLKLVIKAEPILVEPISDFLVGVLGAGVETGARDELLYGTVHGYIEKANLSEAEVRETLDRVTEYLAELADIFKVQQPDISSSMIDEEDWSKSWKEHFKPFAILPDLIIAPTWEHYFPDEKEMVITMDPGMAFGTGHHATTSLSLKLLQEVCSAEPGARLLDVGTGTGILGIAGLLFGAGEVLAVDNDPEAVEAATKNAKGNSLDNKMTVSLAPLATLEEPFQFVVANIVHDVLVSMAGDLARLTAGGGSLILSGILAGEQVDNILAVFSAKGFRLAADSQQEEWAALRFDKD